MKYRNLNTKDEKNILIKAIIQLETKHIYVLL